MQLRCDIFNSILYPRSATKGNKGIFLFFNYEATGPPGAGLQGMYVFIIGRRGDAGFYTWLKWSFLSDLSALVQLHCGSWMFHGKVGWFWALPSSVCCLTETHLLWGRVEVKNSGHDKQRTPGATSDMQPPPSPTLRLTEGTPPCQSTEAWYYAHKFLLFALYLTPTRVVVTFYLLWLWFLNEKRQFLKDKDKSLFARLRKCM